MIEENCDIRNIIQKTNRERRKDKEEKNKKKKTYAICTWLCCR